MKSRAELEAFVNAAKADGATDEFLVAMLRERGWPARELYDLFARRYSEQVGLTLPEPPGRLEAAREAFFHLLAFATLGTWIFAIGSIWFQLIDRWAPDPTVNSSASSSAAEISSQIAAIIVAFPIFIWGARSILRDQAENPDKAESGVRRWVSNLGLLGTALVFMGDLIVFVTSFLQGELTVRVTSRCLVVMLLAGAVFLYYSRGLGKSRVLPPLAWHRLFAGCALLAITLTLSFGFWSTGPPSSMRVINEDYRRVKDLHQLTLALQNKRYGNAVDKPPVALSDLGLTLPADPFTGQRYEYRRLDDTRYQVCAVFTAASARQNDFWTHPAGRTCFDVAFKGSTPYPMNYSRE